MCFNTYRIQPTYASYSSPAPPGWGPDLPSPSMREGGGGCGVPPGWVPSAHTSAAYNLTYLGHRVTLPWLDLRSNFDLDLLRSNYTWFDAPSRDKHDDIKLVAPPLKLKMLTSKKPFRKILEFWPLVTSTLTWAKKMTDMISKWFFASFRTPFSVLLYDAQEPR